jgi:hypothetical protein
MKVMLMIMQSRVRCGGLGWGLGLGLGLVVKVTVNVRLRVTARVRVRARVNEMWPNVVLMCCMHPSLLLLLFRFQISTRTSRKSEESAS